jgi:hypothetical protein
MVQLLNTIKRREVTMFWLDTFEDTELLARFLGLFSPKDSKKLKKSKRSYDLRLEEDKLSEDVFQLPEIKFISIIQDVYSDPARTPIPVLVEH